MKNQKINHRHKRHYSGNSEQPVLQLDLRLRPSQLQHHFAEHKVGRALRLVHALRVAAARAQRLPLQHGRGLDDGNFI